MKRLRIAAIVLMLLLAACSVSFNRPRSFGAIDSTGAPLHPAYLAYSYSGSRPNPVHPVTYRAAPTALARSDSAGRISVPLAFHIHRPFPIETHPSLAIEMVYVPALHNAVARMNGDGRAVVQDASNDPQLWQGSMMNLSSLIHRVASRPDGQRPLKETDPRTAAIARELIEHFRREYEAFLARHRDRPREKPEMPPYARYSSAEEQRRWHEHIDADLAREPLWGIQFTRLFGDDLKFLLELDARLR